MVNETLDEIGRIKESLRGWLHEVDMKEVDDVYGYILDAYDKGESFRAMRPAENLAVDVSLWADVYYRENDVDADLEKLADLLHRFSREVR